MAKHTASTLLLREETGRASLQGNMVASTKLKNAYKPQPAFPLAGIVLQVCMFTRTPTAVAWLTTAKKESKCKAH